MEHEFWKHKAANKLRAEGWLVKVEKGIPAGTEKQERHKREAARGYTDLVAEKDGLRIAVEIETGRSDWRRNLEKNLEAGFSEIFILATSMEARAAVLAEALEMAPGRRLEVVLAQDFVESVGLPGS